MNLKSTVQRYPILFYFVLTFAISWFGAFILVAPKLIGRQPIPKIDGILMFPILILGPVAASLILTTIGEGRNGLHSLWSHITKWKVSGKWYLVALLSAPCLILTVLVLLMYFVSPVFTPNFFLFGLLFGIPAGIFEEIGWTGFAFPKMRLKLGTTNAGVLLGILWGLWHLPVIDFLGAASPHGQYWFPFALSFIASMAAIRMIIVWIYTNTSSVFLAQLTHIISTGSLVILGPSKVTAAEETLWYSCYALALWITVCVIFALRHRRNRFDNP